jgi:thiosulfate dehydrogenase (quinone) large subunit
MGQRKNTSLLQQFTLVFLRTLIGWHFLYEGYYKFSLPGWGAEGIPLASWRSASYLNASTGSLVQFWKRLLTLGEPAQLNSVIKISLALIGISLLLGLFTRIGCWGALALLTLFYCTAAPVVSPASGSEGNSWMVNKTLIEAAAVGVLLVFNTGAMVGLDMLIRRPPPPKSKPPSRHLEE